VGGAHRPPPSASGRYDKAISADDVKSVVANRGREGCCHLWQRPLVIDETQKPFRSFSSSASTVPARPPPSGKLAARLAAEGHKVMLAAGDNLFAPAANEQLKILGRNAPTRRSSRPRRARIPRALPSMALTAARGGKARRAAGRQPGPLGRPAEQSGTDERTRKSRSASSGKVDSSAAACLCCWSWTPRWDKNALSQVEAFHSSYGRSDRPRHDKARRHRARKGSWWRWPEKTQNCRCISSASAKASTISRRSHARDFAQAIAGIE